MNIRRKKSIRTAVQKPKVLLGADIITIILLPKAASRQGKYTVMATTLGQQADPPQVNITNVCTVTLDSVETFWSSELKRER